MQHTSAILANDPIPEYMNVLGMIFSMCGLMMRVLFFLDLFFY